MELFVSPHGNDKWNGLLAKPNRKGNDGPLATLQEALLRARRLRDQHLAHGPISLTLTSGTWRLNTPLELGPKDHDLAFRAAPDATPVVSGGTAISAWEVSTLHGRTCWTADVSRELEYIGTPRSLYVDDALRPRSRYPKNDWLAIEEVPDLDDSFDLFDGSRRFIVSEGDFDPGWRHPAQIEAVVSHLWTEERMPVASYDPAAREIRSTRHSIFCLRNKGWMGSTPCARYYWENVFEALSEPGEWYCDPVEKRLYYLPKEGEDPATTRVVLPHLRQLVRLHGDVDGRRPVRNISFAGIHFLHTDWAPAEGWGKWWDPQTDPQSWRPKDSFTHFRQTCESKMRQQPWPRNVQFAAMPQAAHDLPGAISLEAAEGCRFAACTFRCHGFYAIDIREGCHHLQFDGNTLEQLGGGGFKADGGAEGSALHRRTHHLRIADNTIRHAGRVFASAVGIGLIHTGRNEIAHNDISDLFYTGISVGWSWSFDESVAGENAIVGNHIHNIGQRRLSDMGGIYTLGRQGGTIIARNHIHDVQGTHYGGWGIYLDEGSSLIRVERNLVHRTGSQGLHEHWGRQNVYLDNVFAFAAGGGAMFAREESDGFRQYPPQGALFLRNVILTHGVGAFKDAMTYLDTGILQSDLNLYWDFQDKAATTVWDYAPWPDLGLEPARLDLAAMQARGLDRHSVVADPGIENPENGDFSLAADSPLHALGIRVLDPAETGVRPVEARTPRFFTSFRGSADTVFSD